MKKENNGCLDDKWKKNFLDGYELFKSQNGVG